MLLTHLVLRLNEFVHLSVCVCSFRILHHASDISFTHALQERKSDYPIGIFFLKVQAI